MVFWFHRDTHSQTFPDFIRQLSAASDPSAKVRVIDAYLHNHHAPIVEDSSVHFLYRGKGQRVAAPGELNRWDPSAAPMRRLEGTDLFYRSETLPIDARIEYKFWVDSSWILDPSNPRKAQGGFGWNSELRMPLYPAYTHDTVRTARVGKLDTLWITSAYLQRKQPVYVYTPQGWSLSQRLPAIYVTDGGDYLAFGRMDALLDELIAAQKVRPVVALFVDPHTDPHDRSINQRMTDYAAQDSFLDFLQKELSPIAERQYGVSPQPGDRLILGASMGGLISTYTVLRRPDFISLSAAQSPAYWQADSAVIKLLNTLNQAKGEFYIQTGTIGDTRIEARLAEHLLRAKRATVTLEEFHEGHNWTNWRTKLDRILTHFFPVTL
jgi:enterochelin esterase-like enzyme